MVQCRLKYILHTALGNLIITSLSKMYVLIRWLIQKYILICRIWLQWIPGSPKCISTSSKRLSETVLLTMSMPTIMSSLSTKLLIWQMPKNHLYYSWTRSRYHILHITYWTYSVLFAIISVKLIFGIPLTLKKYRSTYR